MASETVFAGGVEGDEGRAETVAGAGRIENLNAMRREGCPFAVAGHALAALVALLEDDAAGAFGEEVRGDAVEIAAREQRRGVVLARQERFR
jgi:hypothetical protein